MKKLIALCLAAAMILSLCACGGGGKSEDAAQEAEREILTSGDWEYTLLKGGAAEIAGYTGGEEELAVPDELDGHKVTAIGDRAFGGGSFRSVTIPEGVTEIGDLAFNACSGLRSVEIPDSVKTVGANPFAGCGALDAVTVALEHPALAIADGVLFSKADKRLVSYPCGAAAEFYEIPDGIGIIGDYAFADCGLKSVAIPDSVTLIGENAFAGSALAGVELPDSVAEIGKNAFYGCAGLESAVLGAGVTTVGDTAFYGCGSLTGIELPDGLTELGVNPFAYCGALERISVAPGNTALSVIGGALFSKADKRLVFYPAARSDAVYEIPRKTAVIDACAFAGCSGLESVAIPDTVTEIREEAFCRCSGLGSVEIPDSVTEIGAGAFEYCGGLRSVRIGAGVTEIGEWTFAGCGSLAEITVPEGVTGIAENAFAGCGAFRMHVTQGSAAEQFCVDRGIDYGYSEALDWLGE